MCTSKVSYEAAIFTTFNGKCYEYATCTINTLCSEITKVEMIK
jgi:hypothetical protein